MTDTLRLPSRYDPSANAYKDWLHLNVFDHRSGCIAIVNTSLHGAPADHHSRAIGTALMHVPREGWVGNVEIASLSDANIGPSSISLERVALATDPLSGVVLGSARLTSDEFDITVTATPRMQPIDASMATPFGTGWLSWYARPRLTVEGEARFGERRYDLSDATAYHDHNWGRWHWGDDVGWLWGAFEAAEPEVAIVIVRPSDSAHRKSSGARIIVEVAGERRIFLNESVRMEYAGRLEARLRHLPGALAALKQDRIAPKLPARVAVRADDGIDAVEMQFVPRAAAQLIIADPDRPGYGYLHEMVGAFGASVSIAGRVRRIVGLGVFEHMD